MAPLSTSPKIFKKGGDMPMMGEHPIARIIYKGIFDFDGLYKFILNWFKDREYYLEQKDYTHKIPTIFGKEEEFKLNGWRKVTSYYKFVVDVYIHLWDISSVEIIENGKKIKRQKGRAMIEFSGNIETDYVGLWKKSKGAFELKKFLDRFIFRKHMTEEWSAKLYLSVLNLHARVKEYMDMTGKGQVR